MINLPENYILERKPVKHARIRVNESNSVRIIVPDSFSDQEIDTMLNQKEKWIAEKLAFFDDRKESIALHSNQILFLGEKYSFYHFSELKSKVIISHEHKTIRSGLALLDSAKLEKWYRKQARKIILERLETYSNKHGFVYNKVYIRSQKSKWGNCSPKKNVSFNWRLIKAPLFVIDYIVVHELVHTEILKHTKQFWMKLKLIYPDYKKAVNWLDEYSNFLKSKKS